MENLVLIDWLSCTFPIYNDWYFDGTPSDGSMFISLLGMEGVSFEVAGGVRGYSKRLWFDGINIHLPSEHQQNVWLEMSGKGCRAFETYGNGDWLHLLDVVSEFCNITRLDVAFDDHTGILDMQQLVNDTYFDQCFVSKSHYHSVEMSFDDRSKDHGTSVYHGREASNLLIRIYDKAAQLRRDGEKWNRVELQLRRENAAAFVQQYLTGEHGLGTMFAGTLLDNLRYVVPDEKDSNRWRWQLKDYWRQLVDDAARVRLLTTPGAEYNFEKLDNFIFNQAGNSIRTYIEAFGEENFLRQLKERTPAILPARYKEFLERYKKRD